MTKKTTILGCLPFVYMAVFFYFVYAFSATYNNATLHLEAKKGNLVYPDNPEQNLFAISGEFYFTPGQFGSLKNETESYGFIPGSFYTAGMNSEFGYGSYGLIVSNLNPNTVYSLHIGRASSSCSVVLNGKTVARQGTPGTNLKSEIPGIQTSRISFYPKLNGTAEIIFNVSNFEHPRSGFTTPFILGEAGHIQKRFTSDLILNSGMFAVTLSVAFFFFVLGISYKKLMFILWFAFAAIVVAIRQSLFYPHIIGFIFPNIHWRLHIIGRYITLPFLILFFTVFIKEALNTCCKIPYRIIIGVSLLYAVFTVILKSQALFTVLIFYRIFSACCVVYAISMSIVSIKKRHPFGIWIVAAITVLAVFGMYDLLVAFGVIFSNLSMQVGTSISIIIISIMVLDKYADSIKEVEKLNKEIIRVNKSLIRFFPEKLMRLLNKKSITDICLGDNTELSMPILSIDIRSFTHISEKLSPDRVFTLLNEYFALVAPIIRAHGGIIPKYLGDGFFALFPEGSDAAVRCAITIQEAVTAKQIKPAGFAPLKIGIGIDYNDILLGTIGDTDRMDCIIISNAYYMSELLQHQTKIYGSSIMISNRIFLSLKDPTAYCIRPIRRMKTVSGQPNFLFEIYDTDDKTIKELKRRSQDYIELALHAIADKSTETAQIYIDKALSVFPQDRVALSYKTLLENYKSRNSL
ncbi:adenylate/guanylate cyclase domain-containing protein [Treponema sp. OMZ 840]|uniref:adenylate/guanylate cyclase domain-containing protein n=1 Tax=Treponema sp. OMZ 840 TaxID=244313 RepID=UPI003D935B1E